MLTYSSRNKLWVCMGVHFDSACVCGRVCYFLLCHCSQRVTSSFPIVFHCIVLQASITRKVLWTLMTILKKVNSTGEWVWMCVWEGGGGWVRMWGGGGGEGGAVCMCRGIGGGGGGGVSVYVLGGGGGECVCVGGGGEWVCMCCGGGGGGVCVGGGGECIYVCWGRGGGGVLVLLVLVAAAKVAIAVVMCWCSSVGLRIVWDRGLLECKWNVSCCAKASWHWFRSALQVHGERILIWWMVFPVVWLFFCDFWLHNAPNTS